MVLIDALAALSSDVESYLERSEPKADSGWHYTGMRIGVADLSLSGGDGFGGPNAHGWVDIDIETARLLFPVLRDLIVSELRKLGVAATTEMLAEQGKL